MKPKRGTAPDSTLALADDLAAVAGFADRSAAVDAMLRHAAQTSEREADISEADAAAHRFH